MKHSTDEFCQVLPTRSNSAKFYQYERSSKINARLNSAEFHWLDQLLLNSTKFCQTLPKSIDDCVRTCTRIATKNHDYLIMGFSRCSFLFFTQRLILYKSYTLDLNRIYIIPLNLSWSLFVPLHYVTLIPLKMVNKLKSAMLTIIALIRK